MNIIFNSPISSNPSTKSGHDKNGNIFFVVRPRELTPFRAKMSDRFTKGVIDTLKAIFALGLLYLFSESRLSLESAAIFVAEIFIFGWLVSQAFRKMLRQTTTIKMTQEAISLRRWWGWQHFDRAIEHRFILIDHNLTREEAIRNDFEGREKQKEGKVIKAAVYYGQSAHVVLLYAGQRIDLLTVYDKARAADVVMRLQYCDRELDADGGKNSSHHEGAWTTDTPGGLKL
ncbi:hypothetical protein ACO0LM_22360 [Undibacterium sp. Di26W]|uniref:hypothetical protein n=1 Tax=Undibacterium sp. Di26W TaxID=3413035 RepID=UPI003BF3D265